MRFLVSCGPTYESLDKVRRLTNSSTGKLGIGLANYLQDADHDVVLLKGYYAVCQELCLAKTIGFTTTQDLLDRFQEVAKESFDAVFHAAAVSDFRFGAVLKRLPDGKMEAITSGKFGTREGNMFAELVPTPKIIGQLRSLFPSAVLVGWKYEVDGDRDSAIALGQKQITENRTDFCVVNGPAYGTGFGIVSKNAKVQHYPGAETLYRALLDSVSTLTGNRP